MVFGKLSLVLGDRLPAQAGLMVYAIHSIGGSSNGRTSHSECGNWGPIPCPPAMKMARLRFLNIVSNGNQSE